MATRREITKKYAADYAKSSKNAKGLILDDRGELDAKRLTPAVSVQLMQVSGATIDRLLKPTKDADKPKGLSATKAGPLLRNSISLRKARDEHEQLPGFIEADLVVHCGPTLTGEFARTLTATDVFTSWTENVAVRNRAHVWVLAAMDEVVARLPFPLVGLDTDNGGELINYAMIEWAGKKGIYFTRARPYESNDNAHVEQKYGDVVRRHAFHCRYDTEAPQRPLRLGPNPPQHLHCHHLSHRLALKQTRQKDPHL
ncbi:UNVERIFIED_ORG: hypothetical protein J3D58_002260 [Paenarthrobacter nicotinovorans]